jgi:hypothetical protein
MVRSYFDSGYEIRSTLRTLFNSDYFKSDQSRFARVKGPVELVIGAIRMAGSYRTPTLGMEKVALHAGYMGQILLTPPSVEGWHEGMEWVDSGAMVERVNFVSRELSNVDLPGVRAIIDRLAKRNGGQLSPEELVDRCLDLLGPVPASKETRDSLLEYAAWQGPLDLSGHRPGDESEQRVGDMLRLAASSIEFQLA